MWLSNLILTLTGQKLIEWSLKLYMSLGLFFVFNIFSKSKINATLYVFCFVAYVFSNNGVYGVRLCY